MKQKISITLDEETLKLVEESLESNDGEKVFRNRSHVIEFMINKALKEVEEG